MSLIDLKLKISILPVFLLLFDYVPLLRLEKTYNNWLFFINFYILVHNF